MGGSSVRWQGVNLGGATDIDEEDWMHELIDLTDDNEDEPLNFELNDPVGLPEGHSQVDGFPWTETLNLRAGVTVELLDESFLRIYGVFESPEGFYLRGIEMKYNNQVDPEVWKGQDGEQIQLHTKLHDRKNELCAIVQIQVQIQHEAAVSDPPIDAGLVNRALSDVRRVRKVILTNKIDHTHYFSRTSTESQGSRNMHQNDTLYCRWKYLVGKRKSKEGWRSRSWAILHLQREDCDPGESLSDYDRFQVYQQWRVHGYFNEGALSCSTSDPLRSQNIIIDLTGTDDVLLSRNIARLRRMTVQGQKTTIPASFRVEKRWSFPRPATKNSHKHSTDTQHPGLAANLIERKPGEYTFADVLCGAGGTTVSAHAAGLKVIWALDSNLNACLTLELNLPSCQVLHVDLTTWLTTTGGQFDVSGILIDVLHISFACQAFSIANPGTNLQSDQDKIDLSYGLEALLRKVRPRVVTLEQVDGIFANHERSKGGNHLYAQFNTLTSLGYQVRCKVLRTSDYGVAQMRRRLIIIAACPGQRLPPWPKPTHGHGPGQKAPVSVFDVIAKVPPRELGPMGHYIDRPGHMNRSPRQQLLPTVTCSGTRTHPTEPRTTTPREDSMFQGMPPDYQYSGGLTEIRKQIGNHVPPPFMTPMFACIKETMEYTDAEFAAHEADMNM